MTTQISDAELHGIDKLEPEEMLSWAHQTCGDRAGIVTSFQNTGSVMIDMAQRVAPTLRVITVDTLRQHAETYNLINKIEAHYGIEVERFKPDPDKLEQMVRNHGEFLFFDSKAKQEYCCLVRKVEPNRRALETLDIWITGLRRDQSVTRNDIERVKRVKRDGRELIRLCPLADWTEKQARVYMATHDVPCNDLYSEGYSNIGCQICSTPVLPNEDVRAGRWRWFNQIGKDDTKECGIHTDGSGI